MEYVRLGKTGLKVSRIALGCMSYGDPTTANAHTWALNDDDAQPFFRQAVEMGVTLWDTANAYQAGTSEEVVGRAMKRYSRREDIVLATKVWGRMHDGPGGQGLSRKAILEQVDASLARLDTDHIDLYQIHRWDPEAPVEETMEALHDIVKAGKVRYVGASSMYAWQFAKLQHAPTCTARPRSCRCKISTTYFDGKTSGSCCRCAPTWAWVPCRIHLRARDAWLGPGANSQSVLARTRSSSPSTHLSTNPSSTRSNASPTPGARAWLRLHWRGCSPVHSSPRPSSERPNPITCQKQSQHSTCT